STLHHAGLTTATLPAVTHSLPARVPPASSTPPLSLPDPLPTGVWTVPSLANGANDTLTVTATVVSATAKTNTATVTASDQFDPTDREEHTSELQSLTNLVCRLLLEEEDGTPTHGPTHDIPHTLP